MIRRRYRTPKPPTPPSPEEELRRQRARQVLINAVRRHITLPIPQSMWPATGGDYPPKDES